MRLRGFIWLRAGANKKMRYTDIYIKGHTQKKGMGNGQKT